MIWSDFEAATVTLALFGRRRLEGRIAYLATIRAGGAPRVHPVSPFMANDRLLVFMEPTSPKASDLRRDPRYSMHCAVEDNSGGEGEFVVSGRAIEVENAETRKQAFEQARLLSYNPLERYVLFELGIDLAQATTYEDGEPKRTSWKA